MLLTVWFAREREKSAPLNQLFSFRLVAENQIDRYCPVAQLAEHATVNRGVEGSNPSGTATKSKGYNNYVSE